MPLSHREYNNINNNNSRLVTLAEHTSREFSYIHIYIPVTYYIEQKA